MKATKSTIDVSEQFVGILLSHLWWGGCSHSEMIEVDPDDEIEIRKIIRAEIVSHFSNYNNESQHKIKESLQLAAKCRRKKQRTRSGAAI